MRTLKNITQHIEKMGFYEFAKMGWGRVAKGAMRKGDRYLRARSMAFPSRVIHSDEWINMTFGIAGTPEADSLKRIFTEEDQKRIYSEAEQICQRRFVLLGSGEKVFNETIDWHTDFKSGYTWPLQYYLDISGSIGSPEYVRSHADIKVPWELSRMQHHPSLGQAYLLSGDLRYYEEFKAQTQDWIQRNPYKMGPNWACTMDVAIRAVNWAAAAVYFKQAIESDQPFSHLLLNHLKQTGTFIEENLECDPYGHGNNHYLANLTGLVFLGLLLKGTVPRAANWLKQGVEKLESEMDHQVNPDGGSFEGSLSYHRLSAEMFLLTGIILRQNGHEFSAPTLERLEKMCELVRDYTKPNGKAPVIGDADDGRLLTLGTYCHEDKRDHRHLLGSAGVFFNRPDFIRAAETEQTEMKWLYGVAASGEEAVTYPGYAVYPETGLYIYRDGDVYLIVKCGAVGSKGRGGHDHNDQLSFELNIQGADVVIDPGTFVYTADRELRQRFRSVAAHNVPQYGTFEQNTIRSNSLADLFKMESSQGGQCLEAGLTAEGFCFEGTMPYENSGVILRRRITVNKEARTIEFKDNFEGAPGSDSRVARLHLSKDVTDLMVSGNTALLTTSAARIPLTANAPIHPRTCRICESYGTFYEAVCLEWPLEQNGAFTIAY